MKQPLRRIREELGLTQVEFAAKLTETRKLTLERVKSQDQPVPRVTQQALDRAEKLNRVSEQYTPLVIETVKRCYPHKWERVEAILAGADAPEAADFALEAQQEREIETPEGDAWSFALQFRNAMMLDRLASHGLSIGLTPTRLADGLLFTGRKIAERTQSLNEILYPGPQRLGLEPGMVVFLGDPWNHPGAWEVLDMFAGYMVANRWEVKISIFRDKRNYVGYPVHLKTLRVKKTTYTPRRYVDEDGDAMCYEDFGVIFSAGLQALLKVPNPFGEQASHLILVCGLHRLATGAGVKLLEDLDFREFVLKEKGFDFPSGDKMGVLAYRILVRTDNRLWSDVPGFGWSNSTVKEFEVLGNWQETIHKLRPSRHGGLKDVLVSIPERKPQEVLLKSSLPVEN